MRVGILGGTFDPIHLGHLLIAEEARTRLALEEVLFIPTGQPWLKAQRPISPAEHRLTMVRLAIASNPYFRLSTMEVERPGPTYTVDTLRALRAQRGPDVRFVFIVGMDSLKEFSRWKDPQAILELCTVVAFGRPGHGDSPLPALAEAVGPLVWQRVQVVDGPQVGISGTEIRRRVAQGISIRYWVPDEVYRYIYDHGLYRGVEGGK